MRTSSTNALRSSPAWPTRWSVITTLPSATRSDLTRTCGVPLRSILPGSVKIKTVPLSRVTTASTTAVAATSRQPLPRPLSAVALEGHLLSAGALGGHPLRASVPGPAPDLHQGRLAGATGQFLQARALRCAVPRVGAPRPPRAAPPRGTHHETLPEGPRVGRSLPVGRFPRAVHLGLSRPSHRANPLAPRRRAALERARLAAARLLEEGLPRKRGTRES